ncbi:MAG: hypothetical protein RL167_620 [Actinomycetota bacterium]
MKNNTLAMIATIALVLGPASLIGYIDPAVCKGLPTSEFISCDAAAAQHIWGFWGFTIFGAATLLMSYLRNKKKAKA